MKILAVIGSPKTRGMGCRIVAMIEGKPKGLRDVESSCLFLKRPAPEVPALEDHRHWVVYRPGAGSSPRRRSP
jgi:hypothetical protein